MVPMVRKLRYFLSIYCCFFLAPPKKIIKRNSPTKMPTIIDMNGSHPMSTQIPRNITTITVTNTIIANACIIVEVSFLLFKISLHFCPRDTMESMIYLLIYLLKYKESKMLLLME